MATNFLKSKIFTKLFLSEFFTQKIGLKNAGETNLQ